MFLLFVVLSLVLVPSAFAAVMQSATYQIQSDSLNIGGTENSSSASYKVSDTVGETGTGLLSSALYILKAGYRQVAAAVSGGSGGGDSTTATTAVGANGPHGDVNGNWLPALLVSGIQISRTDTSATVTWQTSENAVSTLAWGETLTYELGSLSEQTSSLNHNFTIPNLVAGKTYYFRFTSVDSNNNRAGLEGASLVATPSLDITPPANPQDVTISAEGKAVRLNWQNPTDTDFSDVVVVRSEEFYPAGPTDGILIYRGNGGSVVDQNIDIDTNYFYSIFSQDSAGNYSSGVLISGRIEIQGVAPVVVVPDVFDSIPKATEVDPRFNQVTFDDFKIIQGNRLINAGTNGFAINGSVPFKMVVNYETLPEVLKTILVTVQNAEIPDRQFSFMLRVNRGLTAYESSVEALGEAGTYKVRIAIIDHDNQAIKVIDGKVNASYPFSRFVSDQLGATIHKVWPNISLNEAGIVILIMIFLVGLGRMLLIIA